MSPLFFFSSEAPVVTSLAECTERNWSWKHPHQHFSLSLSQYSIHFQASLSFTLASAGFFYSSLDWKMPFCHFWHFFHLPGLIRTSYVTFPREVPHCLVHFTFSFFFFFFETTTFFHHLPPSHTNLFKDFNLWLKKKKKRASKWNEKRSSF